MRQQHIYIFLINLVIGNIGFVFISCRHKELPNQEMMTLLQSAAKYEDNPENIYCPEAMIKFCDSVLNNSSIDTGLLKAQNNKALALLQLGEEQKAIVIYEDLLNKTSRGDFEKHRQIMKT